MCLHGVDRFSYFSLYMAEKKVGTVTHWYDKISVAVVKLSGALAVGDAVKITHGDVVFEDTVSSMQFDHKSVEKGKKGQEVAIKLSQKAKEGSTVSMA